MAIVHARGDPTAFANAATLFSTILLFGAVRMKAHLFCEFTGARVV